MFPFLNHYQRLYYVILISFMYLINNSVFGTENNTDISSSNTSNDNKIITVTADKGKIKNDLGRQVSVKSYNQKDIRESGDRSVNQFISDNVAGAYIRQKSALGNGVGNNSTNSISLRGAGATSESTLIIQDGIPNIMPIFGHSLNDSIATHDIGELNLYFGPASVLFGSGAIGGVVEMQSYIPEKEGLRTVVSGMGGSWNTWDSYFAQYGRIKNVFFGVSFNYQQSDNDFWKDYYPDKNLDARFFNRLAHVMFGADLNANWRAVFNGYYNSFSYMEPYYATNTSIITNQIKNNLAINDPIFDSYRPADVKRVDSSIQLFNNYNNAKGKLTVYGRWGKHEIDKDDDGWVSEDTLYGIWGYEKIMVNKWFNTLCGIDVRQYTGHGKNEATGKETIDYGKKTIKEGSPILGFSLLPLENLELVVIGRYTYNELYNSTFSFNTGLNWDATDTTLLSCSFARGYKNPSMKELYYPWPFANENLKPETIYNYEVKWEQTYDPNRKVFYSLKHYVSLFSLVAIDHIKSVITRTPPPPPVEGYIGNDGTYKHLGASIGLMAEWIKGFKTNLDYTFIEPNYNLKGDDWYPAAYTPRHKFNVNVSYEKKFDSIIHSAGIKLMTTIVGDLYYREDKNSKLENFTDIGAMFFVKPFKENADSMVYVKLENILDKKYSMSASYPIEPYYMPGFSIYAGFSTTFDYGL